VQLEWAYVETEWDGDDGGLLGGGAPPTGTGEGGPPGGPGLPRGAVGPGLTAGD